MITSETGHQGKGGRGVPPLLSLSWIKVKHLHLLQLIETTKYNPYQIKFSSWVLHLSLGLCRVIPITPLPPPPHTHTPSLWLPLTWSWRMVVLTKVNKTSPRLKPLGGFLMYLFCCLHCHQETSSTESPPPPHPPTTTGLGLPWQLDLVSCSPLAEVPASVLCVGFAGCPFLSFRSGF